MKYKYIVTGYDKKRQKMSTHPFDDVEIIAQLINMCEEGKSSIGEDTNNRVPVVKNPKDLDFNIQSRASHYGAEVINTPNFCWSIILVK